MSVLTTLWCPGSGAQEIPGFEGECPVCAKPVHTPPTRSGGYVIERHVPMVLDAVSAKTGVHGPACRRHSDDECICEGAAA